MRPLAQEWAEKAEADYLVATALWRSRNPIYDAICFHAQQCAEKYLKAWLTHCSVDFPKTHDLLALAKLSMALLPELADVIDNLRFLTSFAVEVRYPGFSAQ